MCLRVWFCVFKCKWASKSAGDMCWGEEVGGLASVNFYSLVHCRPNRKCCTDTKFPSLVTVMAKETFLNKIVVCQSNIIIICHVNNATMTRFAFGLKFHYFNRVIAQASCMLIYLFNLFLSISPIKFLSLAPCYKIVSLRAALQIQKIQTVEPQLTDIKVKMRTVKDNFHCGIMLNWLQIKTCGCWYLTQRSNVLVV